MYALHPQYLSLENLQYSIPENLKVEYKHKKDEFIAVEYGENRLAFPNQDAEVLQVHADHYFRFNAEQLYKAADRKSVV